MSNSSESGSALSVVVLGLAVLTVVAGAGFQTARQAHLAAAAAMHAGAALHACEEAFELYAAGAWPALGSFRAVAAPAAVDVSTHSMARLPTGELVVRVVAAAQSPASSPAARRTVARVFRVDTLDVRKPVEGTWRERM